MTRPTTWYRNASSKYYHAAAVDWVSSGKAMCGARIAHPGFVWMGITLSTEHPQCKRCKKARTKEEGR